MNAMDTNFALRSRALTGRRAIPAPPRPAAPVSRGGSAARYPGAPGEPSTWQVTLLQDLNKAATAGRGRWS